MLFISRIILLELLRGRPMLPFEEDTLLVTSIRWCIPLVPEGDHELCRSTLRGGIYGEGTLSEHLFKDETMLPMSGSFLLLVSPSTGLFSRALSESLMVRRFGTCINAIGSNVTPHVLASL